MGIPAHQSIFWESRRMHNGSHRKGARELITDIVTAQGGRDADIEKLVRMAERYVKPPVGHVV